MVVLNAILRACPSSEVLEIEMGMAHRGRLNVLANFVAKSLPTILYEFTPNYVPDLVAGDGDVKYHLGYESVRKLPDGEVRVSLAANPSHLEAVNPVVEGKARARQRLIGDDGVKTDRKRVLPILIHGDAAFAGQGSVAEVLNLSQLPGYRTGGTIHVIVNNQIGFTTMPADARSSSYATDVAKMIEAPILHVNGEGTDGAVLGRTFRARVPAALRTGRGDRHVLLPSAGPQRDRSGRLHPAAHLPQDPVARQHRGAVQATPDHGGRSFPRRRLGHRGGNPEPPRGGPSPDEGDGGRRGTAPCSADRRPWPRNPTRTRRCPPASGAR